MTTETVATFRPPSATSTLPHLGTYRRTLPVSWARLEETMLDWERLPHLHAHSYAWIEREDAGAWGWRARVGLPTRDGPRESLLELVLHREECRVQLRHLSGASAETEIWTHAVVHGARSLSVVVDFFVPGIAAAARTRLGEAWAQTYHRLYDEDEAMMVARDAALAGVRLAPPAGARIVEQNGARWRLVELADGTWAMPTRCPHRLGPLEAVEVEDGVVQCPWHGYRFDVRTGRCLTGQSCRLPPARRIEEYAGGLRFAPDPSSLRRPDTPSS